MCNNLLSAHSIVFLYINLTNLCYIHVKQILLSLLDEAAQAEEDKLNAQCYKEHHS